MRVLLFGTGKIYQNCKQWFVRYEIIYLLDNDTNKQGQWLDGTKIVSPADGTKSDFDAVFILSSYIDEMREELFSMGVDEGKIFSYRDIRDGMQNEVMFYGDICFPKIEETKKRILVITHNLRTTGAEVVLLEATKILKNNGYEVVVATQEDGTMRQAFVDAGVFVIIDCSLSFIHFTSLQWINKLKPNMVFINTVYMHHLFKCGQIEMPVIWWLHDSEALYNCGQCEGLDDYYHDNIKVYAVSNLAKIPFQARCPKWPVDIMPYGVKDVSDSQPISRTRDNGKIVFATVGAIERRKAQGVLFEAIRLLPSEERRKCEFWLIYQPIRQIDYGSVIVEESSLLPEVKMMGQISHEKMGDIYNSISALICPSISDTLPTVTVEAMQYCRPCIVSDGTGTADYIEDYRNGFVCPAGDVAALADKILWMVRNKDRLSVMGQEARKTYEKWFALDAFENNLMRVIV